MAMGKNKTGIMAAITAAAEASRTKPDGQERAQRTLPKGTIGSVRAGLGGIQDIDVSLILPWGPQDRFAPELTAVHSEDAEENGETLIDSIRTAGQQVPVLLRPAKDQDGHFEVIYGRRRIQACRALDIPVKALIRTLDDAQALMAKGLENASRTDLSFYERARFAKAILAQGHSRADVMQALAISKNSLSQLERITRLVPDDVGDGIGAAPGAGRPKWMVLATAFEDQKITKAKALGILNRLRDTTGSDDRLDALITASQHRGAQPRTTQERSPVPGVSIKTAASGVSVTIKRTRSTKAFADWLDSHLDALIEDSFERFQKENRKE